jgi:hypothetical protein
MRIKIGPPSEDQIYDQDYYIAIDTNNMIKSVQSKLSTSGTNGI